MKHAHKHHEKQHEVKLDLTSMIDIVFLLVMFFVLTSRLSLNRSLALCPGWPVQQFSILKMTRQS